MKRIYLYIFVAMEAALTLVGCANEDIEPIAARDYPSFSALIDGVYSRATDDYWENGDKIGISGGDDINVCYVTCANDTLMVENPEQQIYFPDSNPVAFTAYYPYNSSRNASTGIINITTADQTNQKKFDFLWAVGEGSKNNPTVQFNFTHKMSKISFIFKNGKDMDVSSINKIRLNGLVVEGIFDTTTGICEVIEAMPTASSTLILANVTEDEPVTPLFLIPQTVVDSVKLEIYDSNSQYFVCNLTVPDNELVAGTNYKYTITVSKTGLKVTGATLSDWIEQEGKSDASSADE